MLGMKWEPDYPVLSTDAAEAQVSGLALQPCGMGQHSVSISEVGRAPLAASSQSDRPIELQEFYRHPACGRQTADLFAIGRPGEVIVPSLSAWIEDR
jgi:hypothetical protein